jgi:hypothetical protein
MKISSILAAQVRRISLSILHRAMPLWNLIITTALSSSCSQVYEEIAIRIASLSGSCCIIRNSVFVNLNASSGGAIYLQSSMTEAEISHSTFLRCNTTTSGQGGACYVRSPKYSILHCCASSCSAYRGTSYYVSVGRACFVNFSTFVLSIGTQTWSYGTLFLESSDKLYEISSHLNFTACESRYGSALTYFHIMSEGGGFSELTVIQSISDSGIFLDFGMM